MFSWGNSNNKDKIDQAQESSPEKRPNDSCDVDAS